MKRNLLFLTFAFLIICFTANANNAGKRLIRYGKQIDKNGRLVHDGDTVTFRGIVQSQDIPAAYAGLYYFFSIYDSTGNIMVYMPVLRRSYTYIPVIGDSVELTGVVQFYTIAGRGGALDDSSGFAVIQPLNLKGSNITLLSSGNAVHAPLQVTKLSEKNESNLIQLDSFELVNPAQWRVTGRAAFETIRIRNVNDTNRHITLYVPYDAILGTKAPYGVFNVAGIEFQDDSFAPFFNSYSLIPRAYSDFTVIKQPIIAMQPIINVNRVNGTGLPDSNGKLVWVKGVVQSPNLYTAPFGGVSTGTFFSIFDASGSIMIYNPTSTWGYTPLLGDSIFIEGTVGQIQSFSRRGPFNTGWVVINMDSLALPSKSRGNKLNNPIVVTAFADSIESKIIKLTRVRLVDPTQWDTSAFSFGGARFPKTSLYVDLVDDNNNFTRARITNLDSLFYIPVPQGGFNITGIEAQDTLSPAKYSIWPRFPADIEASLPYYQIIQVKGTTSPNLKSTAIGLKGYLKGIINSENLYKNGVQFSLIDNTGAITVFSTTNSWNFTPVRGDSVKVAGTIQQVNGLTIIAPDSMRILNAGHPEVTPAITTVLTEADESYPRHLMHVKLMTPSEWNPAGSSGTHGFTVTVQDTISHDTFTVFISNATTAFNLPAPTVGFNVAGIIQQDDPLSPFTSGYYLEPRDSQDIWLLSRGVEGIDEAIKNSLPVELYPNPVSSLLYFRIADARNESINARIYSMTGQLLRDEKTGNTFTIDISNLPQGMYIIKFNTVSGLQAAKTFIRQ